MVTGLKPTTGAIEAFALSVALLSPTLSLSFSVPLAAQEAGRAVPLVFIAGFAAILPVCLCFMAFSRRIANAGSATAYVAAVMGNGWGFITGWTLLLAYALGSVATAVLTGIFASVTLGHFGIVSPWLWLWLSIAASLLALFLAGRRLSLLTRILLGLEGLATLAILGLAAVILTRAPSSAVPFRPDPAHGVTGIGAALVFGIFAFSGFESSATLSEETHQPDRSIPLALIGALLVVALLLVVGSYVEVMGFGLLGTQDLARASSPLDELSTHYISSIYGAFLDIAAAVSSLAVALGCTTAASRMLYALSRAGLTRRFAVVDARRGTPQAAINAIGITNVILLLVSVSVGGQDCAGALAAISTLAIILVYMAVCLSQAVDAARDRRSGRCAIGLIGVVMLVWPLFSSLYPVPAWPKDMWPVAVAGWLIVGILILFRRPHLRQATR